MAKQLVSPIERHVEKGVLAVAGILFLGAVARYLVTSPNRIDIGGERVPPGMIDQKVADKASDVRHGIRNQQPPESDFEPLYREFAGALDPFQLASLSVEVPAAVPIGPEVPTVDRGIIRAGEKKLVDIVPLSKPVLRHGRSTFSQDMDGGSGEWLPPSDWVTVSALFPVKQQMERQRHEYGPTRDEVVFARVELQRRMQRDDGSWSRDDWDFVQTWPVVPAPREPEVRLVEEEGQWILPRTQRTSLERFLATLRQPKTQLDLIRPLPHLVRDGTPWEVPVITTRRDVLVQDYEYLYPDQPLEGAPDDRYPDAPAQAAERIVEQKSPKEIIEGLLAESERYLELAQQNCSIDDVIKAHNRAFTVKNDRNASRRDKARASRLVERASYVEADIKRGRCRGGGAPGRRTEPDEDSRRERLPVQQLWAHDAHPASISNGNAFQYRLRVWLYNRLAGEPDKFSDHRDAEAIFIKGPWSEPSDPVFIEPDTYFFLTRADSNNDDVTIEFYKWFEGIWVRYREDFKVGDALEGTRRCEVPAWADETIVERPTVEFSADATIVAIDHQQMHRERGRAGRGGVRLESPSPTCCVVFVDSLGRLHERLLPTDKNDPVKATVSARLWRPPKRGTRTGP